MAAAFLGMAALCGPVGPAGASEPPKNKAVEPPVSTAAPSTESSSQVAESLTSRVGGAGGEEEAGGLFDRAPGRRAKWFEVGGSWETHGLLWQTNTGAGDRKLFNFAYAYASLNLTRNDRIRVRAGFYQFLLADETESGFRGTDISVSYSHLFRLPARFDLRASAAATIPVSFYSQKAGLYTAPTLNVALSRILGAGFAAQLDGFGGLYFQKYSSTGGYDVNGSNGGSPSPSGLLGGSLEVDYAFWFHKRLVIGADGYVAWVWYHDVGTPPSVMGNDYGYGVGKTPGAVSDGTLPHQPVQQLYGFELFLRYSVPVFYGVHTDLLVALAEGDPTLGYVSRNIDGVSHFFGNYYRNFEMYGALSLRY